MEYKLLYCKNKRPNNSLNELKKELINYLKEEFEKGHIPSRRELEKKFHLRVDGMSKNIDSLYEDAGLKYKLIQNQSLKSMKADLLLKIILNNLEKMGLKLYLFREVRERGIDIIAEDSRGKVGIELKAYNTNEKLKKRDLEQVKRFIEKEKLNRAIIITTTNLIDKNIDRLKNISIINNNQLTKMIKNEKEKKDLSFIKEHAVSIQDNSKNIKRQKILDYVLEKYKKDNRKPNCADISKNLHLDIYTYFKDLFEIYKNLKIPPPLKNMRGKNSKIQNPDNECINLWKEEFKKYILEEISKNKKYPSGKEISKHFGISHIWNITRVSDLYRELKLKPYLEREKRITYFRES